MERIKRPYTLQKYPFVMTIICNIQNISKILGNEMSFNELENMSYTELQKIQDELISLYNIHVKDEEV